jgi:hypothetical protein
MRRLLPILLLIASAAAAAEAPGDWQSLQKHVHKQVTVQTKSGDQITGQLVRVEDGRLFVQQNGSPSPIDREVVTQVTVRNSRHTAAWIAGGSAAGAALGLLVGLRTFDDSKNASSKIAGLTALQAGVGAAAGLGLSRLGKPKRVVYIAP